MILAVATAITLCWLMLEDRGATRQSRLLRIGATLGERSYSLYAVHTPVIVVALAFGAGSWGSFIAVLCVAEGCFRLIERPSQRLARRAPLPGMSVQVNTAVG